MRRTTESMQSWQEPLQNGGIPNGHHHTTPRPALRSSEFRLTGSDIAFLSESYAIGFSEFPPPGYSDVSQGLDGWWGHTGLRAMPLALLRSKLRLALFGAAPDRRTEKRRRRQVDELIAEAINTGEVQLVREGDRW